MFDAYKTKSWSTVLHLFASETISPEAKRKTCVSRRSSTYADVLLTVDDIGATTVLPMSGLYDELQNQLHAERSGLIENSIRSMITNSLDIENDVKRNLLSHLRFSRYRITHTDSRTLIDDECTESTLCSYLSHCNRNKLTARLYVHFPSRMIRSYAA